MENNEGKIFEVPKWEYKKIRLGSDNTELAELGKKGWEAVGVDPQNGVNDLIVRRRQGMENNEGKIFEVPKWEYKKIRLGSDNTELAELGKKGWEAVGVDPHNGVYDLLLKRQIGTVRLMEVSREQTPPAQNRGGGNGYDGY